MNRYISYALYIPKRLLIGTFRWIRWTYIQFLVFEIIKLLLNWADKMQGNDMMLFLERGFLGGIAVYTFAFCLFYSFVPIKHFLKTFWLPYIAYIYMVKEHDWHFNDNFAFMSIIYLAPLFGATIYCIIHIVKKRLRKNIKVHGVVSILFEITIWVFTFIKYSSEICILLLAIQLYIKTKAFIQALKA